jgi:hypothetical protein
MNPEPAAGCPQGKGHVVGKGIPPGRQPQACRRFAGAAFSDEQEPAAFVLHQRAVDRKAPSGNGRFVDGEQGMAHLLLDPARAFRLMKPEDDVTDRRMPPVLEGV